MRHLFHTGNITRWWKSMVQSRGWSLNEDNLFFPSCNLLFTVNRVLNLLLPSKVSGPACTHQFHCLVSHTSTMPFLSGPLKYDEENTSSTIHTIFVPVLAQDEATDGKKWSLTQYHLSALGRIGDSSGSHWGLTRQTDVLDRKQLAVVMVNVSTFPPATSSSEQSSKDGPPTGWSRLRHRLRIL